MRLRQKLPTRFVLGDDIWDVEYKRNFKDFGECDPSTNTIRIKSNLSDHELLATFFHEFVHALEFSFDFELEHEKVYLIEHALTEMLLDHFVK